MIGRRQFLFGCAGGLAAGSALPLLGGCAPRAGGGAEPGAIKWDRELCTQCRMVLSDRRFAVQMQGGPENGHWNFDDIGCALTWLAARGWPAPQQPRLWVASLDSRGEPRWLDARQARYITGHHSPMGYDFGAVEGSPPDSLGFEELRARIPGRTSTP